MTNAVSSVESRALTLLGSGLGPEIVSSATGVSTGRISQLMSDPIFAAQVLELRFTATIRHTERDNKWDRLEDKLLDKIEELLPLMMEPMKIARLLGQANAAKRRASGVPDSLQQTSGVVNLTLPISIVQNFTQNNTSIQVNAHNQVVRAQDQELVTIQSGAMSKLLEQSKVRRLNDERIVVERTESLATSGS